MEDTKKEGHDKEERIFRNPGEIFNDIKNKICEIFPPEFNQHLTNSRKEKLLALRSLIDHALENIEHQQQELNRKKH